MQHQKDPAQICERLRAACLRRELLLAEVEAALREGQLLADRAKASARDRRAVLDSRAAIERSKAALSRPVSRIGLGASQWNQTRARSSL